MLIRLVVVSVLALFPVSLAGAQDQSGPKTPSCDPPPCLTDIVVPVPARDI